MVFFWSGAEAVYSSNYYPKYIYINFYINIYHYSCSSLVQMQANKEGGTSRIGSGGSRRRSSSTTAGASSKPRSAVIFFFFLVILIFTHLGFCLAKPDETDRLSGPLSPRKARFLETTTTTTMKTTTTATTTTTTASFRHAPISPAPQSTVDMINGEDKRIVHTGPNPLHN